MKTKLRYIDDLSQCGFVLILLRFSAGNKNINTAFDECFLPAENSRMCNKIKTNNSFGYKIIVYYDIPLCRIFSMNLITDSNPFLV